MKANYIWIFLAMVLICAPGCRNRNQYWNANPLSNIGGPCTIAPPATGSYQVGTTADPYYGTTIPALPASGNATVPAQPASTVSPGWRPAGSQVPAQPASTNQTSLVVPNGLAQIPMNNVVSSTQTSLLRPNGQYTANIPNVNSVANMTPQLGQQVTTGMPVNDSTNLQANRPMGNWNQIARQSQPGVRNITGSYEYSPVVTRSGVIRPNNYPYNTNGSVVAQSTATTGFNAPANNPGWQERNTNNFQR